MSNEASLNTEIYAIREAMNTVEGARSILVLMASDDDDPNAQALALVANALEDTAGTLLKVEGSLIVKERERN